MYEQADGADQSGSPSSFAQGLLRAYSGLDQGLIRDLLTPSDREIMNLDLNILSTMTCATGELMLMNIS